MYIDEENDVQTLDIDSTFFTVTDNAGSQFLQPVTIINKPKTTFGFADLYQTFSFRATVQDQSNNAASCEAQVFVTSKKINHSHPVWESKLFLAGTWRKNDIVLTLMRRD